MALRRWKNTAPRFYERWHPWRMEVRYWYGEWLAWVQGEQAFPCRHPTRKAAMAACEKVAFHRIQAERKRQALWRPLLLQLAKEEAEAEHGNP